MINNERKLLLLIKITPIVTILIFSIFVTALSILQNNTYFEEKTNQLEKEMTNSAKNRTKEEVQRVYESIKFEKNNTEKNLKENIKERVNEAHSILTRIYNENISKSKKDIEKMMKDALRDIRFNNERGYYFLYEMNGNNILLPPNKMLEGKNFWNLQDAHSGYTIRNMSNLAEKNKESFYTWWWYKPGNARTQFKKIGFVKYFEPFDWFIGTGEYVKDFEKNVQEQIIERINNLKYGKNGYFFLFDYNGLTLSHVKKEYRGVNRMDVKDPNGYMIIKGVIDKAKDGSGFINYIATIKPMSGQSGNKISYVKGFDDWEWALGSGAYLSDVDKLIEVKQKEFKELNNQEIKKIIFLSLILTSIFIFLSFVLSKKIQSIFLEYKQRVHEEIYLNKQKDIQIMEQSKMASMGEMIGNIAHQWRQPLSIISTASTGIIMQKEFGILDDTKLIKTCNTINDNAQYLSKTIDDFKNFIKGDRSKKVFNLKDDIESFLHLVEGTVKTYNINIVQDIQQDINIDGYENELTQCLINIFNNAKDALEENILTIDNKLIFISTSRENNDVIIKIKDNAGGIPNDVISHIFEPYFTTKHQSQGTGLGLHMTYNLIVDGMNGSIKVNNVDYKHKNKHYEGAEFTIRIPIV
jgi:signal transduction histidine kinase